jgi:hypothetical protein
MYYSMSDERDSAGRSGLYRCSLAVSSDPESIDFGVSL